MIRKIAGFGWKPDLPDQRDFRFKSPAGFVKKLPASTDLRKKFPPVYHQEQLGSCTGNAIGAAFEFGLMKQKAPSFTPSRLFIYYNERVMERTVNEDNGAEIRNGIKSVNKLGACPETLWPYVPSKFCIKPPPETYAAALNHQVLSYQRVTRSLNQMKGCLASGYPFIFGITVYESFEEEAVAKSGKLNMPAESEKLVSGHAVLAVGYNDKSQRFIVRNSWGKDWGLKGYFTIPYDYLMNEDLSDDFWTIRVLEENVVEKKKK